MNIISFLFANKRTIKIKLHEKRRNHISLGWFSCGPSFQVENGGLKRFFFFCGARKTRVPSKKNLRAGKRTNNKLNSEHMSLGWEQTQATFMGGVWSPTAPSVLMYTSKFPMKYIEGHRLYSLCANVYKKVNTLFYRCFAALRPLYIIIKNCTFVQQFYTTSQLKLQNNHHFSNKPLLSSSNCH